MKALIIVDVQNDFCEGGALAVAGGTDVAAAITVHLAGADYDHVVATRDWHVDPGEHFSAEPNYSDTWPVHCVAGTWGAQFHELLDTTRIEAIFDKGQHSAAYSGFEGEDESGKDLNSWLLWHDVDEVDVVGIATDYCVLATAVDAAARGRKTRVLLNLTAGVSPDTTAAAIKTMRNAWVEVA